MTTFNEREKAAENKYAHDKELSFRIHARRTKLLGQWAASRMNLSGAAVDEYAKSLIGSIVNISEEDLVVARIKADLSAKGVTASEQEVRTELFRVNQIATDQIMGE